jgi:hypothetical protein
MKYLTLTRFCEIATSDGSKATNFYPAPSIPDNYSNHYWPETRHNALVTFDAVPVWGSPHVGTQVDGNAVREVGISEVRLPAA